MVEPLAFAPGQAVAAQPDLEARQVSQIVAQAPGLARREPTTTETRVDSVGGLTGAVWTVLGVHAVVAPAALALVALLMAMVVAAGLRQGRRRDGERGQSDRSRRESLSGQGHHRTPRQVPDGIAPA
jgi:hypothetical protein